MNHRKLNLKDKRLQNFPKLHQDHTQMNIISQDVVSIRKPTTDIIFSYLINVIGIDGNTWFSADICSNKN